MEDKRHRDKLGAHGMEHGEKWEEAVLPPLRFLLVEDNPVNQTMVLLILKKKGHTVTVVGDGQRALEELEKHTYDVVLMDIRMPGMSGDEAAKCIRASDSKVLDRDVPIIAMTAYSTDEDVQEFLDIGMDGFIGKPMTWETVSTSIYKILQKKGRLPG